MKIYKVLTDQNKDESLQSISEPAVICVSVKDHENHLRLPLDRDFMFSKYGFHISDYECSCFSAHVEVWEKFKESGDTYCLIMDANTSFNMSYDSYINDIQSLLGKGQDWDVFFPYEPLANNKEDKENPGNSLGFRLGVHAYFVNKKGVESLLKIPVIKQPLDEEMIELSVNESLNVFFKNTGFFNYTNNVLQVKHRQDSIKEAVLASNAWSEDSLAKARQLLAEVSNMAQEAQFDLVLSDGSLLGYIRHGGIMPWDDDVDLGLNEVQFPNFISLIEKQTNLTAALCYWHEIPYLKIWSKDGSDIPGHFHKFPFVDIWCYKEEKNSISFYHGVSYPIELYKPFSTVFFEQSYFKIPAKPHLCLDIIYPNWRQKIQIFRWSHQSESNKFFPLSLEISIDKNGRIIP
jgi:GR25 family glycosyltransferase involved in LPS biosynthesis